MNEPNPPTDTAPAPPEIQDVRLVPVWDAISSPAVKAVSTDVFDTLLWRTVPEPIDAFPVVARRLRERGLLCPDLDVHGFARLREAAERRVRTRRMASAGQSEIRIDEIYQAIPAWVFGDDSGGRFDATQVELDVEHELVVPDLDVIELLAAAARAGKQLIAISDTYLSAHQLRGLLAQPGFSSLHLDEVFSSSDHRVNKSGGLFEIVLRALGLSPAEMVHLGDNLEADVDTPARLGLSTFYFERRPEAYRVVAEKERRFLPAAGESAEEGTLASGLTAARTKVLARPGRVQLPAALRPHWDYGAVVLGPLMAGFAEWIHGWCERTGEWRVLCLMREGAFLAELIDRAGEQLGRDLEAVPFWLNRTVLLRASIAEGSPDELNRFMHRRSQPTVEAICRELGVALSELPDLVGHARTTTNDSVVRALLLDRLSGDDAIRVGMVSRARELRERIGAYIDLVARDETRLTLVDLGWGASIQGLLRGVLDQSGREQELAGLYLLTHEGAADHVSERSEVHGFLGDFGLPARTVVATLRSPEVLEQVCMPPFGTQIDLDENLEPVLAPQDIPALQQVEADAARKGILAFQREWGRYRAGLPGKLPSLESAKHLLRPILLRSVVAPTAAEVATLGAWHHDENQGSRRTDVIADPAVLPRLRYMGAEQARDLPMTELYWPFGLAAQVDEHWPELMAAAAAGQISWGALAAQLETGAFRIQATRGIWPDDQPEIELTPTRNRFGLSSVTATLWAPQVTELTLRPAQLPCIMRIDWIELRCWPQGHDVATVRLGGADVLAPLRLVNCIRLGPNLVIVHGGQSNLAFDVGAAVPGVVARVDVEVAFASLAIPHSPALAGGTRFHNIVEAERAYDALVGSLSWRATAPLRRLKGRIE